MAGSNRLVEFDEASWKYLRDGLKELGPAYKKAIRAVHRKKAEQIAPVAANMAPRGETGRLARSVKAAATANSGQIKAGSAARAPHAPPIHWGWPKRHIKPRRFIVWALAKVSRDTSGGFEREYAEAIVAEFNKHLRNVDTKVD